MKYVIKNKIREHRARLSITQETLAKAIGKSRVTMSDIEQGKRAPSFVTAMRLAEEFETTVNELFTLEIK